MKPYCVCLFRYLLPQLVPGSSDFIHPSILAILLPSALLILPSGLIHSGYDSMVCCLAHLVAKISCSPYTRDGRRIVSSRRSPAAKQTIMCCTRAEQSFAAER